MFFSSSITKSGGGGRRGGRRGSLQEYIRDILRQVVILNLIGGYKKEGGVLQYQTELKEIFIAIK